MKEELIKLLQEAGESQINLQSKSACKDLVDKICDIVYHYMR